MTVLLILLPILSVIGLFSLLSALLRFARRANGSGLEVAKVLAEKEIAAKRVPVLEEKLRLLEKELADEKDHVECLLRQRDGFIEMRRESEARVTELEADVARLVKERDDLTARRAANLRVRDYVNPNPVPRPPCANCGSAAGCLCLVGSNYIPFVSVDRVQSSCCGAWVFLRDPPHVCSGRKISRSSNSAGQSSVGQVALTALIKSSSAFLGNAQCLACRTWFPSGQVHACDKESESF